MLQSISNVLFYNITFKDLLFMSLLENFFTYVMSYFVKVDNNIKIILKVLLFFIVSNLCFISYLMLYIMIPFIIELTKNIVTLNRYYKSNRMILFLELYLSIYISEEEGSFLSIFNLKWIKDLRYFRNVLLIKMIFNYFSHIYKSKAFLYFKENLYKNNIEVLYMFLIISSILESILYFFLMIFTSFILMFPAVFLYIIILNTIWIVISNKLVIFIFQLIPLMCIISFHPIIVFYYYKFDKERIKVNRNAIIDKVNNNDNTIQGWYFNFKINIKFLSIVKGIVKFLIFYIFWSIAIISLQLINLLFCLGFTFKVFSLSILIIASYMYFIDDVFKMSTSIIYVSILKSMLYVKKNIIFLEDISSYLIHNLLEKKILHVE